MYILKHNKMNTINSLSNIILVWLRLILPFSPHALSTPLLPHAPRTDSPERCVYYSLHFYIFIIFKHFFKMLIYF